MKKILFITAHMPSESAKYAGHRLAYNHLSDLVMSGNCVDLVVLSNASEFIDWSGIEGVKLRYFEKLNLPKKLYNCIVSRRFYPFKLYSRFSNNLLRFINENIHDYDIVRFEFTHSFSIMDSIEKTLLSSSVEVEVCCHDVITQWALREGSFLSSKYYDFEKKVFSLVDRILVLNSKDKKILESIFSVESSKIKISPPKLSSFVYPLALSDRSGASEKNILFWGAMDRPENEHAVINFISESYDLMLNGGYRLYVVGSNPTKKIKSLACDNVIVTGFVDDPSEYFLKCYWGIVPLERGAGIKLKTLEMLHAGLNVVSTDVGAEGISHDKLKVVSLGSFKDIIF
ncbi:glycosyltransferase [Marinomonas communis]|uniref:glycosyltransferase n=1 Tax=Marinomonas communis TaxID=28254 RepID=UPI001D18719F|nr:glycosyltransferase [Marinomonas communis]MCC4275240.1 glycosyltransferase family 4 protein [Marinomonas communis]